MHLNITRWVEQRKTWPGAGRHILAQHDADNIIVYQAYRPDIADWAVEHQRFGGPWSKGRMTWIKPNFLWMMYRAGWATKESQERILAITMDRRAFEDQILGATVASSFEASGRVDREVWKASIASSDVRLQWDPDHAPNGGKLERRAVQLGLRGKATNHYSDTWCRRIEDITPFVQEQRQNLGDLRALMVPVETVVRVRDAAVADHVGLDAHPDG